MEYDGDVLDELLSGAWFDSSGNPLAEYLPERISDTFPLPTIMAEHLKNFTFVDGKKCTMQQKLRKTPSYDYSYALLIKNIDKQVTIGGAAYSNWTYFKYSNAKLDMKETVYTDDKVTGQKYYYATDVALKTEKPISEEQAKEIRGKYTYEKLQFTPFVN